MFSRFLPGTAAAPPGVAAIAKIFTLNSCVVFTLSTLAGERMARNLRDPARARPLIIFFGLMLAAVASWLIRG